MDEPGGRALFKDEKENPRILTNFGDFCFGDEMLGFAL